MSLTKKIKNNTESAQIWVGQKINPGEYYEIQPEEANFWMYDPDLEEAINAGNAIVNNGIRDLNQTGDNPLEYLRMPASAADIKFDNTQTGVGLSSENVQEALEELEGLVGGSGNQYKIISLAFLGSGTTKNKWLYPYELNQTSDRVPAVLPFNVVLNGLSYSNREESTYCKIELYKNGSETYEYQWDISSYRYAYKTNNLSSVTFSAGDRLSLYLRYIETTGYVAPKDPVIYVTFSISDNTTGEGGV
jgi:hypothetical protein